MSEGATVNSGDTYNPRLSVIQPEITRIQHVLELVRAVMRDELVPADALVPIVSHVVDALGSLSDEPGVSG